MTAESYRTAPSEGPSCRMHALARATETCGQCGAPVCDVCATLTASGIACQTCEPRIRFRWTLKAAGILAAMGAAVLAAIMSLPTPSKKPEFFLPEKPEVPLPGEPFGPAISHEAPIPELDTPDASIGILETEFPPEVDRWPGDRRRRRAGGDAGRDGRDP